MGFPCQNWADYWIFFKKWADYVWVILINRSKDYVFIVKN
jgi:hypothetical protein